MPVHPHQRRSLAGWYRLLCMFSAGTAMLTGLAVYAQPPTDEANLQLARKAIKVLDTYCYRCHGVDFRYPGLDVTNRETLLRPKDPAEDPYIVPGKPNESRIWEMLDTESMPPENQPQPTADEREMLKRWISEGAEFPKPDRPQRQFLGEDTLLSMIDADLRDLSEAEGADTRYFSLAHLWNDTSGQDPTSDDDLKQVRAAVSKLINSLSSMSRISRPRLVDEQGTLMAIRLRDYGWSDWHWRRMLREYPYGLKVAGVNAAKVYRLTSRIPYVRADWFAYQASRPPLYHELLGLPQNARTLEDDLGVDIFRNFHAGALQRAAFEVSGVSRQNRMVERHDTKRGGRYYWKSHDTQPNAGERGDFTRRPLGPVFEDAKGPGRQLAAFEHDGGEIIYSLQNGLQGYLLVDGKDRRIDVGPLPVVSDPNQYSGSFEVVSGISCMGCHRHGMVSWDKEDIRPLFEDRAGSPVADKVLELFPPLEKMRGVVAADERHFMTALEEAIGPFLRDNAADKRDLHAFAEPITKVSNRYQRKVTLEAAARELGLNSPDQLKGLVRLRLFAALGLGNFANEGVISRETWERAIGRVARELGIGVPIQVN